MLLKQTQLQPLVRAQISLLTAGAALLAACFVWSAVHTIVDGNRLNFVSGAWSALAVDLSEGVFYRPVASDLGFGGTRYMPLNFVLQAVAIEMGFAPLTAGHLVAVSGMMLLLGGVYLLMQQLGIPPTIASAGTLLVLAADASFVAATGISGDVLAAAFNVLGLALCARAWRSHDDHGPRATLAIAAACFTLAFTAKITAVHAPVIACAALMLNRQRRPAIRLATFTTIGISAASAAMYLASDGRILETMRACATGGGSIGSLLLAPLRLSVHLLAYDPLVAVALTVSVAIVFSFDRRGLTAFPAVALVVTVLATLAIFGSPGTGSNHFIDVFAMAVVFLAAQASRGDAISRLAIGVMVGIAVLGSMRHVETYRDRPAVNRHQEIAATLTRIGELTDWSDGPIISEDSLVPIAAGDQPYANDSWMLRILSDQDPAIAERMEREMTDRKFRAIVLCLDPARDGGRFLEDRVFGRGFTTLLSKNYELQADTGRYSIYRPRP